MKKPIVFATYSSTLSQLPPANQPVSIPQCHFSPTTARRGKRSKEFHRVRNYATISPDQPVGDDALQWPSQPDPRRIPTPYQIFNQHRTEPYSKRRFYELVKLYHPDTSASTSDVSHSCSTADKLERYRLIVAANAILCDPERRSAYDRSGAGWQDFRHDEEHGSGATRYKYSTYHRWREDVARKYSFHVEDDCMYNATWEDWERWYDRVHARSNPRQSSASWSDTFFSQRSPHRAVCVNNHIFISIVALLALLGGMGQATRANEQVKFRSDRMSAKNEQNVGLLSKAREDSARAKGSGESSKDRLKRWVREKEDYEESEPDGRTAALEGDGDGICRSGKIKDRDEVPFWKRPPEPWGR